MFLQGSLLGVLPARFDDTFAHAQRRWLDAPPGSGRAAAASWVEWVPHWLSGADDLFDQLVEHVPWRQRKAVPMYGQLVDEPRLTAWCALGSGRAAPLAILDQMRDVLARRYDEPFDSLGFNLYRDRHDSVAWHGDRHRHIVTNPVIAIVSLGRPRPLRLRPRGGGPSIGYPLGEGDLFVMGGACQHDWEHCVPKLGTEPGPRLSVTFRCLDRAPV